MAELKLVLNGKTVLEEIAPDMLLLDFVRSQGCYSVKRGCETANCGLCTVLVDGTPMLSCSTLAMRANGKTVTTMEGMQEEAAEFGAFLANLCRCTGYMGQLRAIQKFLKMKKEEK